MARTCLHTPLERGHPAPCRCLIGRALGWLDAMHHALHRLRGRLHRLREAWT